MTVQEVQNNDAVLTLKLMLADYTCICKDTLSLQMAIQALQEVEQYRALGTVEEIIKHRENLEQENHEYSCIGTVEELKEAMEKQVAKKPIVKPTTKEVPKTHTLGRLLEVCCPVCGKRVFAIYESDLERGSGLTRDVKGCSRCLQAIDFTGYYCNPKLDKADEDIDWEEGGTSD